MAAKGDKSRLYDVAMRMYVDGNSLTDIEAALGVSRQTLSTWKADSKRPSDVADAWDRARKQKRDGAQRVLGLYYRELAALEEQPAGTLSSKQIDMLSKLGALVVKWEQREENIRKQEREKLQKQTLDAVDSVEAAGPMTAEALKQKIREVYGV